MPSTGDGSMAGGSNKGTLRKGASQASGRGGLIGTLPTKNFDCFLAPTGLPTTTWNPWPPISGKSSVVEITEASDVVAICALALATSIAGNAAMFFNRAA